MNKLLSWIKDSVAQIMDAPKATEAPSKEQYYVVGETYYMDGILSLRKPNPEYEKSNKELISEGKASTRIFQHYFKKRPVTLVREPENPHDKNAVRVEIAGVTVGYISRDDNRHVSQLLGSNAIDRITAYVSGGRYMVVAKDGGCETRENPISVTVNLFLRK